MKEDKELGRRMETALIERAKGGPNADPPVSERKVPRASVLAQGCARRTYYWLVGAPEDPLDALGACAFQDGKDFEDGILLDFSSATLDRLNLQEWPSVERQVPCETTWFRGSADYVMGNSTNPLAVVDAKSSNPASFDITVKKGEVSESYRAQLSLYAFALGAQECIVVYRQKGGTKKGNPQVYAVFRFAPDLALVEKMKAQAQEAMDARDGKRDIPERAFTKSAWQCQYCQFRTHCWSA